MPHYETYQSNAGEVSVMRRWVAVALVLSLALHAGLIAFFKMKKLENFGTGEAARLAPPVHVMTRVSIPKIPEQETRVTLVEKTPSIARITLPEDKPQLQEVRVAPQLPDQAKPIVIDKPKAEMPGSEALAKIEASSRGAMEKELSAMAGSLLKEGPLSPRQPVLTLPPSAKPGEIGTGETASIPGRQSLDEALSRTGPLPVGDKPIGMPGGALYEYDSATLRPEAIVQLQKLGELIRRNPNATFSIEGHTDATGNPAYNQTLSERRAESVKAWLVQNMGIASERIQTRGFGSTKLIVPADKSVDEQQPNRRVEIVIKTNRK